MNYNEVISEVEIFGLHNAIKGSKYPMAVDLDKVTDEPTNRTKALWCADKGSGHDCSLKGVIVQFDLTLTNKCWTEAERYNWLDFISSQSTMHRITKFDLDKAYIKYVDPRIIEIMKEKVAEYNKLLENGKKASDEDMKERYLEILYSNPAGFRLTAKMSTNYLQLKTIYGQRKNHRLPEWRAFCKWIESLPMFEEYVLGRDKVEEE